MVRLIVHRAVLFTKIDFATSDVCSIICLALNHRYGVALVGVRPAELPEFYEETILLNPGPRHIMKKDDTCYYMSITKEENSAFVVNQNQTTPDQPKEGSWSFHSPYSIPSHTKWNFERIRTHIWIWVFCLCCLTIFVQFLCFFLCAGRWLLQPRVPHSTVSNFCFHIRIFPYKTFSALVLFVCDTALMALLAEMRFCFHSVLCVAMAPVPNK